MSADWRKVERALVDACEADGPQKDPDGDWVIDLALQTDEDAPEGCTRHCINLTAIAKRMAETL